MFAWPKKLQLATIGIITTSLCFATVVSPAQAIGSEIVPLAINCDQNIGVTADIGDTIEITMTHDGCNGDQAPAGNGANFNNFNGTYFDGAGFQGNATGSGFLNYVSDTSVDGYTPGDYWSSVNQQDDWYVMQSGTGGSDVVITTTLRGVDGNGDGLQVGSVIGDVLTVPVFPGPVVEYQLIYDGPRTPTPTPEPRQLPSGDYLYAIDCSQGALRTVDPQSASSFQIGTPTQIQHSHCGLQPAFDASTNTSYYLAGNNSNNTFPLVSIDLTTGASTFVANIWETAIVYPLTGYVASMAIDSDGNAIFVANNTLYNLNLETGQIIPSEFNIEGIQDDVFATAFGPDNVLYFLDIMGNLWDIDPNFYELSWLQSLPLDNYYSLQIDSSGTFWFVADDSGLGSFTLDNILGSIALSGQIYPNGGPILIGNVAPPLFSWTDVNLSAGQLGVEYIDRIEAQGFSAFTYSIIDGELPVGLEFNDATGEITGTTSELGTFAFTIQANNETEETIREFSITVATPEVRGCVDYSSATYLGQIFLNLDGTVIGCDVADQPSDMMPQDWQQGFEDMLDDPQNFDITPNTRQQYSLRQGAACDDCSIGADGFRGWNAQGETGLPLGFDLNFFGTTYNTVFVNSNGSLSFGSGSSDWSKPLDTLLNGRAGVVAYGADMMNSEIASVDSHWGAQRHGDFFYWGKTQYEGQDAFVATWINQLSYESSVEDTAFSSYQIILVDSSAGDGNIIINYGSMASTSAHGYDTQDGCDTASGNCIAAGIGTIVDGYPLYASIQDDSGFLYNGLGLEQVADSGDHPLSEGRLNSDNNGQFIFQLRSGTVDEIATKPGIPTDLTTTSDGNDGIDVSWSAPVDNGRTPITGYVVNYRMLGSVGNWRELTTGQLTTHIANMPVGTYEIKVAAVNAVGTGFFTATSTAEGGVPMAPEWNDNLFPVLQAGVEIDILFDAVSSTEVTYSIEGELPEGVLFDTATGQFSGTPSGNSEYSFTIWAENEFGRTSFEIANHVRSVDPYLIDGNPIELNPGEVSVYEDDTSIDSSSRTTLNHEAGGEDLLLETESGNLRLTGTCNEQTRCVITQDDNGNEILSLFDQGTIDVSGTGFMPGTTVFVYANSTPRLLGSVRVDRDGTYLASFRLSGLNAGNHTVQARGVGNNGSERAENVGIVVLSGESDPGVVPVISDDLARTGNNFEQMLLAATLLASMGIALRIMSPRRRLK